MIRDLRLRLLLDVQPDQRQKRHQRQRGDEAAQLVAALRHLRHGHDDGRGEQVFGDQPVHGAPKCIWRLWKVDSDSGFTKAKQPSKLRSNALTEPTLNHLASFMRPTSP
jgi:hypothetical protein